MEVTRVDILVFFMLLRGKQSIVTMKDAIAFSLNFQVLHLFVSLYLSTEWFFDWLNWWIKSLSNQRWECELIKFCLGYLAFLTGKEGDGGEERITERCPYQHCWSFKRKYWVRVKNSTTTLQNFFLLVVSYEVKHIPALWLNKSPLCIYIKEISACANERLVHELLCQLYL